jgi:hypothetical protein
MRTVSKLLLVIIIVCAATYALAYAFLALQGKSILVGQMRNMTQRHVEIGAVHMVPPLRVKMDNILIDGIGKASSVEMTPSLLALMQGKVELNSVTIVRPEFTFSMPARQPQAAVPSGSESAAPLPEAVTPVTDQPSSRAEAAKPSRERSPLIFHHLRIIDGTIVYVDPTVSAETGGIKIVCSNVDAGITNIYESPQEMVTKFALTAQIPWKDSQERGKVSLEGWMNYFKGDMRAEIVMKDIDALYLYPYYESWFSLDRSAIEKAKLSFTSSVTGLNNDVTAACHLELTELAFKQREDSNGQSRSEKIANRVLDFFKAMNNGKVLLNFSIKTKMDSPDFGMNVIKNAFDNSISQVRRGQGSTASKVAEMPGQVVGGTVKGVTDVSSALIGGVVSVGRELGKSIGLSFKKEHPEAGSPAQSANETNVVAEQKTSAAEIPANETINNTAGQ